MDWVKLLTKYPRDKAIAMGSDAQEVMFMRGLAYCGEAETHGFIPDQVLHTLTRRPSQARKIASQLVPDLWAKVPGGYQVRNWHVHQEELESLLDRRRRDADRQRRKRRRDRVSRDDPRDVSRDIGRDGHTPIEEEEEQEDAAAAASARGSGEQLAARLDVLRSKMAAHTPLRGLRWDKLDQPQTLAIEDLIATHGDQVLVDVAVRTCRNPPPVLVNAFLGTWLALPDPGQRLRLVDEPTCTEPGHDYELARCCRLCAAERLTGERQ